jgi:hypothetical protein
VRAGVAPGDGLVHPVPVGAILLLLMNDHVWKRAYGAAWTGKLSDVAGLVFFPLLVQAAWEIVMLGRWRGPSRRVLELAVVATVLCFAAIKLWVPAGEVYRVGLALLQWPVRALTAILGDAPLPRLARVSLVRDPTDLFALPAVAVAVLIGRRRVRRWQQLISGMAAAARPQGVQGS